MSTVSDYKELRQIKDGLAPLFERAEKEGLWFNSNYQDLWFSPSELKRKHEKDEFLWGACNWTLRKPSERTHELKETVDDAKRELAEWEKKLNNPLTTAVK